MHKYKVGDTVKILRCDVNPELINKVTKIKRTWIANNKPAYDLFIVDNIMFFEESIIEIKIVTNFEYYAEEIKALNAIGERFAVQNGKIVSCYGLPCSECEFNKRNISCHVQRIKWLYEEAKPKKEIILSEKERKLLEILFEKYKYIARDKSKKLYAYVDEPYKDGNCPAWRTENLKECFDLSKFDDVFGKLSFAFVEWEDDAAYKISDLLALPKVK